MSEKYYASYKPDPGKLVCAKCDVPMQPGRVVLEYMGNEFPIEMPVCPVCGQLFIPEELAMGRILDVEQALEDK